MRRERDLLIRFHPLRSDRDKVAPLVVRLFCVNPIWFIKVEQIHALGLYRKRCRPNAICSKKNPNTSDFADTGDRLIFALGEFGAGIGEILFEGRSLGIGLFDLGIEILG